MPKASRGLPKDFQLHVPAAPVQLGDYLDEPAPASPHVAESSAAAAPEAQLEPAANPRAARPAGPPRKQFNMTPETLRIVDELLMHIRHHSAERDVRASELFHALVLAVEEVRPLLDLSRVAPRGRWGSASAAALPIAMKDAFQDAIARARQGR